MLNSSDPTRLYFDALKTYQSYDDAWLGPILYPLSLALIAQAIIYADLLKHRLSGKPFLPGARQGPSDSRVETTVLFVMFAESFFAVACIWQCTNNFSARAFVGGSDACDLQAFYATYYNFSSLALAAFGTVVACTFVTSGGRHPWLTHRAIFGGGVAIHAAALLLAAVPLMGNKDVGGYMFAQDYCMYKVEGGFYAGFLLTFFFGALAFVLAAVFKVVAWAESGDADRRAVRRLALLSAGYFVAINLVSVIIVFIYLAQGYVLSEFDGFSIYGAQAIVLHSNQLFVPLLFGWKWRAHMHAATCSALGAKVGAASAAADASDLNVAPTPTSPPPSAPGTPDSSRPPSARPASPTPSVPVADRLQSVKVAWEA